LCARYLRVRDLQREIEEGLNVMESSNGANSVIAYGKGGEIASNRRDEQEMFVLCLRTLQTALVYVNTPSCSKRPGRAQWADNLTPADQRGLTPLFWIALAVLRGGPPGHELPPAPRPRGMTLTTGWTGRRGVQSETLVISLPQQQVGLAVPGQSGGALLVTVTSHPQAGSTQR